MGDWISDVNGRSANGQTHINPFAGHTDWRLPQVDGLRTILSAEYPNCTSSPCIDPIFGPTVAPFWSATRDSVLLAFAWGVNFSNGFVFNNPVSYNFSVSRGPRRLELMIR